MTVLVLLLLAAPDGLGFRAGHQLPATYAAQLEKSVAAQLDRFLGPDVKLRTEAKKRLVAKGPLAAVAVKHRQDREADPKRKARLAALIDAICKDREASAVRIKNWAQALATVSKRDAWWGKQDLGKWRVQAKIFHIAFVSDRPYAKRIARTPGMFLPYKDLPAAAAIYRRAAAMYRRLAKAAEDGKRLEAAAVECEKRAAALGASRVK